MNRCLMSLFAAVSVTGATVLALGAASLPGAAMAQIASRPFPANALRGTLRISAPPQVTLDGKADRLSPGARIHNPQNLLVQPATLIGQDLTVNYVREASGLIHEVWMLTADEAREKRAGATGGIGLHFNFGGK